MHIHTLVYVCISICSNTNTNVYKYVCIYTPTLLYMERMPFSSVYIYIYIISTYPKPKALWAGTIINMNVKKHVM